MNQPPPDIIIADGQPLLRDGLRLLIENIDQGSKPLEVENMDQLRQLLIGAHRWRVIIFSLALPGAGGLYGLAEIITSVPAVPVIAMSVSETRGNIAQAISMGARGYVLTSASREVQRLAIALVLAGETYVPAKIFALPGNVVAPPSTAPQPSVGARDNPIEQLTVRQREVLLHLIEGQTNKQIARQLGVNETTVKSHLKVVMRRLGASNRTQAARTAFRLGCRPEVDVLFTAAAE